MKEDAASASMFPEKKSKIIRGLLIVVGTICLVLGVIGIVLPIVPTTPFLLAAAACYLRSSKRLHQWLLNNKWVGAYIKNYQEGKGIPLKTKIIAISTLWITLLFSAFFVVNHLWFVQVILLVIAVGVSVHILRLPTFRGSKQIGKP